MPRLTAPLLVLTGLVLAGTAYAGDPPVDGAWQKHEDTFSFMGFTSRYSCEGLEEKLSLMLKLAGARPGFKVTPTCAAPAGMPDRIATARDRIVFGHWSALGYYDADGVLGLDTGCAWGGTLTARRLDGPGGPVEVACATKRPFEAP